MDSIDVSIIIINYKTAQLVLQCVDSIQKMSFGFSYEIIIVDNSCDVDELNHLVALFHSNDAVRIINPNKNLGTSAGNNFGVKYSKGEYVLLLNSDTLLVNNAIGIMLAFAKKNPISIVGSNLYTKGLKPTHSFIKWEFDLNGIKKVNSIWFFAMKKLNKRPDFNYSNRPIEVHGYICSAALLISRNLYQSIGGSNERLFMYADDPMLCFDAKHKKGARIFNVPSAKIVHLEGGSDSMIYSDLKLKDIIFGKYTYLSEAYGSQEGVDYLKYAIKTFRIRSCLYTWVNKTKSTNDKKLCNVAKDMLKEKRQSGI